MSTLKNKIAHVIVLGSLLLVATTSVVSAAPHGPS